MLPAKISVIFIFSVINYEKQKVSNEVNMIT